jgi:hypothetical protein
VPSRPNAELANGATPGPIAELPIRAAAMSRIPIDPMFRLSTPCTGLRCLRDAAMSLRLHRLLDNSLKLGEWPDNSSGPVVIFLMPRRSLWRNLSRVGSQGRWARFAVRLELTLEEMFQVRFELRLGLRFELRFVVTGLPNNEESNLGE